MKKPSWLYDSKAGQTVHFFMYGYLPTTVGITRAALSILLDKTSNLGHIANQDDSWKLGQTLRIRRPVEYAIKH